MIPRLLLSLFNFSDNVPDIGLVERQFPFTLEIGKRDPMLMQTEKPAVAVAPVRDYRSSAMFPHHGSDTIGWTIGQVGEKDGDKKRLLFWNHLENDFLAAKDKDIVKVIKRAAPKIEALAKDKALMKHRYDSVLITHRGEPIVSRLGFRQYWLREYVRDVGGTPTHHDFVTGKPCIPRKSESGGWTHSPINNLPGTSGDARTPSPTALCSYDKQPFTYEHRQQALNLPMASSTDRKCAAALSYLALKNRTAIMDFVHLILWPSDGSAEHPIIPLALQIAGRLLKTDPAKAVWDQLRKLDLLDDTPIDALVLYTSKSRITPVYYKTVTAGNMLASLLTFHKRFHDLVPHLTLQSVAGTKSHLQLDRAALTGLVWSTIACEPYNKLNNFKLAVGDADAKQHGMQLAQRWIAVTDNRRMQKMTERENYWKYLPEYENNENRHRKIEDGKREPPRVPWERPAPTLEECGVDEASDDPGYLVGRLTALTPYVRWAAKGARKKSEITTGMLLKVLQTNPADALIHNQMSTGKFHDDKLRSMVPELREYQKMLGNIWTRLPASKLPTCQKYAAISGFHQQLEWCDRYADWFRAKRAFENPRDPKSNEKKQPQQESAET